VAPLILTWVQVWSNFICSFFKLLVVYWPVLLPATCPVVLYRHILTIAIAFQIFVLSVGFSAPVVQCYFARWLQSHSLWWDYSVVFHIAWNLWGVNRKNILNVLAWNCFVHACHDLRVRKELICPARTIRDFQPIFWTWSWALRPHHVPSLTFTQNKLCVYCLAIRHERLICGGNLAVQHSQHPVAGSTSTMAHCDLVEAVECSELSGGAQQRGTEHRNLRESALWWMRLSKISYCLFFRCFL